MGLLTKLAYYACSIVSALVVTFFFLAALFDSRPGGSSGREVAVVLVAGAVACGLLWVGFLCGHRQHKWLTGILLAAAAPVAGGALMFVGLLLFGNVHWQ